MDVHPPELGAAMERRKHLAGVQKPLRIERAFQALLLVEVVLGEHDAHQVALLDPDAVLAGQHPAHFDAQPQDVGPEGLGLVELSGLVGVVEDQGVQVAVAGVKHVGDPEAVRLGHLGDAAQDLGHAVARDGAVHAVVVRRDASDRGERGLAAGPEVEPLGLARADPDRDRPPLAGEGLDPPNQVLDLGLRPVELDDQERLDIERVAGVDEFLGGADRGPVHHLQAARDDAGGDDPGDAVARRLVRGKADEHGPGGLRCLEDAHRDLGDDAQQPFGAGHQAQEVVAPGVQMLAAEADDLAAHQHHLDAQDVVGSQPVFEAVDPARVLGDVAADGADDLAGGVGRVIEAALTNRLGDGQIGHAGLGDDRPVVVVDLQDPVELAEPQDDAVGERQRPARQRGPGPARHDLDPVLTTVAEDPGHLLGGVRQHHDHRHLAVGGEPVGLIGLELVLVDDDPLAGHDFPEPLSDFRTPGDHRRVRL